MKSFLSRLTIFAAALSAALFAAAPSAHAASGLYLSPGSASVTNQSVFAVQLRLGDSSATGVRSNLSFDPARLGVVSTSTAGSAFSTSVNSSAGSISINGSNGSGNGDRLVATISFKALAAGSAPVTFTGANQTSRTLLLITSWSNVPTTNASYIITAPATTSTTPPTSPVTPPSAPAPASNQPSQPAPDTAPQPAEPTKPSNTDDPSAVSSTPITAPENKSAQTMSSNSPASASPETSGISPLTIIAAILMLFGVIAIWAGYNMTHFTHTTERIFAAIMVRSGSTRSRIATLVPSKLLAVVKAPKLLASGIKNHPLLSSGPIKSPAFKRWGSRKK